MPAWSPASRRTTCRSSARIRLPRVARCTGFVSIVTFRATSTIPQVATQPVACHHCENAPCEQVCPVAATVHSDEGLNDMVYNRCIGTRYCANNCPYKVRRFNFFDYNKDLEEPNRELAQLVINPEVTVRSRGVMEKCTYCVQRIQSVQDRCEKRPAADRRRRDQNRLPAGLPDSGNRVWRSERPRQPCRASARRPAAYGMLAELNVKPRTKYLARIRNPNPLLEPATATPEARRTEATMATAESCHSIADLYRQPHAERLIDGNHDYRIAHRNGLCESSRSHVRRAPGTSRLRFRRR